MNKKSVANEYPNKVKERLKFCIRELSASLALYVKSPEKDFTRKRKLPFETVMQLLISMGGNSIYNELLESYGYDVHTPTAPAFVQQRDKILPSAFEVLLHKFTQSHTDIKKYRGYRLCAVDGSDLHITTDPNDPDTYYKTRNNIIKGHNLLHLNAMYDLCNRLYLDAFIQPSKRQNEKKALTDMVERSRLEGKVIIVADRNYESYNLFAHIEKKCWNYVIRVKDLGSTGILSGLPLPQNEEFDICIKRTITKKRTNEVRNNPDIYKILWSKSTFDFIDSHTNPFYPMTFRIVRFKITDKSYQTVITNLDSFRFPPDELKNIYKMRWGIETSFRELKYTIGLVNFHAKKREYIVQEIFARLIMYNFAEMITSHVVISYNSTKHTYRINFTNAVNVCRQFLHSWSNAPPPDVEALLRKRILPVRPNRKNIRNIRAKTAVSFTYRIA
jgi:hypothetical protein